MDSVKKTLELIGYDLDSAWEMSKTLHQHEADLQPLAKDALKHLDYYLDLVTKRVYKLKAELPNDTLHSG